MVFFSSCAVSALRKKEKIASNFTDCEKHKNLKQLEAIIPYDLGSMSITS